MTVASAGGRVDTFYVDNGFKPATILVMTPARSPESDLGFDVECARDEDGSRACYIDVDEYRPAVLERVRDVFDDDHAIYVMTKELSDR